MSRTICEKCKGCGTLVNNQDGIAWVDADRKAVRAGEVTPAACDACKGVGSIPEAEAKPQVSTDVGKPAPADNAKAKTK